MYLNTPGMTQEDGVRPTQEGTSIAKDSWLLGAGASMIVDSLVNTSSRRKRAAKRKVAKIQHAKEQKVEAIHSAREDQRKALQEARQAVVQERKAARKARKAA